MKAEIVTGARAEELETEERCFIVEAWNDPGDPDVSLAQARVAPGVTTANHRLDVDERYVVLSGRGRMEIEGCASKDVGPGDVALVPKGKSQRIQNIGDHDLVFYCVCTPRFEPRHYHPCK